MRMGPVFSLNRRNRPYFAGAGAGAGAGAASGAGVGAGAGAGVASGAGAGAGALGAVAGAAGWDAPSADFSSDFWQPANSARLTIPAANMFKVFITWCPRSLIFL
jgi:hypothetical protein